MYKFTFEQLSKYYIDVLGYTQADCDEAGFEGMHANLDANERKECAEYNGVTELVG